MSTLLRRCYSEQPISGERVLISGSEAHHLLHVLRVKPGDRLTLFDGSGREFAADAICCGRKDVELQVAAGEEVDRELPFKLAVGVALPKGDRARWLVEKLVELGAARLVPLKTQYGESKGKSESTAKLQRYTIEASKQCGRNQLMAIAEPQDWSEWIAQPNTSVKLVAHPGGKPFKELERFVSQLTSHAAASLSTASISIGPEGGFSEEEIEAGIHAGWQPVDLGPRILRIETAALALTAQMANLQR